MIKVLYNLDKSQNCPRLEHSQQPNAMVIRAEPRIKEVQNVIIAIKQAITSVTVGLKAEANRVSHQNLKMGKGANPNQNPQMLWVTKLSKGPGWQLWRTP